MKNIVAVIPMRVGSQRVINKNFRPFAGKTLFEHKVDIIKQLDVDDIIVNTDSDEAIEMAKEMGLSYHKREPYYASSECTNSEYHEYLAKVTPAQTILIAQATSPMVTVESFNKAIELFKFHDCNSLMSVKSVKEFLWHNGKAVNYDPANAPNSQNLPHYVSPTFGIVVVDRGAMIKSRNFICSNPYFMEVDQLEAADIDTMVDFEYSEFMFKKYRLKEENIG